MIIPARTELRGFNGGMMGLGDCPSFAPYPSANGGCSNVPPGISTEPGYFGQPIIPPVAVVPYQWSPTPGLITSNSQDAQAKGDAAVAKGRSLGVPTVCQVVPNCSPIVVGGSPSSQMECRYESLCSVNGGPMEDDAGLLLQPSGFSTALNIPSYQLPETRPGTVPVSPYPVVTTPAPKPGQQAPVTQPGVVTTPNPSPPTTGQKLANAATPAGIVTGVVEATGLSTTTLLLIAGGVALYLMTRGGGRS